MLKSFLIAQSILRHLETFLNGKNLDLKNTIFYSYWHDEKALALSLLKSKKNATICISRAHGWDVEYKRHTPAYLPFKKFIIEKLNQTYTISERGKTIFDTLLNAKLCFKTNIARLGKSNHRTPLFEKKSDKIIICSCSNLVSLKRVHLIIDLLKNIEKQNINWIHFGDGPLQKELSNYAKKSIPHVHFEFRGLVTNDLILDFYSQHFVDLFINFSEIEGIPVSIMEAQSAGIPVLATSVGGTPEIVNDDNGFLVEKDFDMHKICSLVTNFLDSNQDYQTEKRKFAFNNWQNKYNADKNYTSFAKALNEL
jgi:glycosyltransferase involved in cell wall biosynthesis